MTISWTQPPRAEGFFDVDLQDRLPECFLILRKAGAAYTLAYYFDRVAKNLPVSIIELDPNIADLVRFAN